MMMAGEEKRRKFQKDLGFDNSHQWLLYMESMQNFFDFFWNNVTEANILTENEVLEEEEMKRKQMWLENDSLNLKKLELDNEYPGLFNYTEYDIEELQDEIKVLEKMNGEYNKMLNDLSEEQNVLNLQCCKLENEICKMALEEKELSNECLVKAKHLEELQKENKGLYAEVKKSFSQVVSPPLFIHQMPLNQYIQKCDIFMQYFNLYMKEHFKIQQTMDVDNFDTFDENAGIFEQLGSLERILLYYTIEFLKEKSHTKATEALIEVTNISKMNVVQIEDMQKDIRDYEVLNEHLKLNNNTLFQDLRHYVDEYVSQRIEMLLFENSKAKYDRALKRHENDKHLTKIISDALLNAELVWIAMQLDLEKAGNCFDNSDQLAKKAMAGWQRINQMKCLQNTDCEIFNTFGDNFSNQLSKHLKKRIPSDVDVLLQQYQTLQDNTSKAISHLLKPNPDSKVSKKWSELNRNEISLKLLVYDGPLSVPVFDDVKFLRKIFTVTMKHEKCKTNVRYYRNMYQENVVEKFKKDKLWRYKQCLWIWFLTEPKRVELAIEEVKKEAAIASAGMKALGGIRRKP